MIDFWKKFWAFAKPIAVIVIAFIGWVSACNGFDGKLFLAIIVLSIVLRGKSIGQGFMAIIGLFKKDIGGETPPNDDEN